MSSALVIKPVAINDTMLISTNVAEADHPAWSAATSYTVGDRVIRSTTATHRVYENLIAGTNATPPEDALTGATPRWLEVQPTNRWSCFDNSITTATVQASSVSYRITPGQVVNGITLQNVDADSVRIRMVDPVAGTVYDKTTTLGRVPVSGWHPWYFSRRPVSDAVVHVDLPSYYGADILIDVTKTTGNVSIGMVLMGYPYTIGMGVQYGAKVGITDYSVKTTDTFGNTYFRERSFAKRASFEVVIPNEELDATYTLLASLRATPCLWVGSDRFACTQVFGWAGDFDVVISYHNYSTCSLDLKGLT